MAKSALVTCLGLPLLVICIDTAIALAFQQKPNRSTNQPKQTKPTLLERGRKLYATNCAQCHGERGKGDGPAAKVIRPTPRDHAARKYTSTLKDQEIRDIVRNGGMSKGKLLMPSHPHLTDDDLSALVVYVRSLSGKK